MVALRPDTSDDAGSTDPEDLDLPAIGDDQQRVRLADYAGQPVVVNLFASWCFACDAELPGFAKLSRQLEGQVTFIGVNAVETGDPMSMPQHHDITWWPLASDTGGRKAAASTPPSAAAACPSPPSTTPTANSSTSTSVALPEPALRQRLHDLCDTDT